MPITETKYIWRNGEMIPWHEATTHILTHGLHYGTSVFEGMRAYNTKHKGVCIFRNKEHFERFKFSARVYRIEIPYTSDELMSACRELIKLNELSSAYIRPVAFLGYGEMGPSSLKVRSEVGMAAFPWGAYLGEEGMKNGVDVSVSSWRRLAPGTVPAGVKAGGNYLSSRLISMEAKDNGYAEGIGLSHDGTVSEGAGENLFVVHNGRLLTPPAASSILAGITRNTVIQLAKDLGYTVEEQALPRELLYGADEIFMTGTAAEVTPVKSVDKIPINDPTFPITRKIQDAFFGIFNGETNDNRGWLDPIN